MAGALGTPSSGTLTNCTGPWVGLTGNESAAGNKTWTGRWIVSTNGALSAPAGTLTGTWITGGTTTTTKPYVLIEPAGATSTLWSTAGTGLGINAASGFTGHLIDCQVNGSQYLRQLADTNGSLILGGTGDGRIQGRGWGGTMIGRPDVGNHLFAGYNSGNSVSMPGSTIIGWLTTATFANDFRSPNTGLWAAAAGVISCVTSIGGTGESWIQNTAGLARVTSDVTNASTTMATATGLSRTLKAGRKYAGRLVLFLDNSTAADGVKIDFDGGTATMTSFEAAIVSNVQGATLGTTVSAAIATDMNATALSGTGRHCLVIEFSCVCNAAGTFIVRQAKDSHTTGTLTIRTNSYMQIEDMP